MRVVLVLLLVSGVKQSQLLVLRLSLEFDKRRDSKELNELVKEQSEELDKILSQGYLGKDLNSRIYKMKTAINGPKHKKH